MSDYYHNIEEELSMGMVQTDRVLKHIRQQTDIILELKKLNEAAKQDAKEAEAYAEELEAKLAKAVKALEFIDDTISWEINPSNYGHDEVCDMNRDWGEIGNYVEAALAELNGETDE